MSAWILIAISAYLLFALNGVIDKILLTKAVNNPLVYVFYNGTLAPLVLFLLPFGVRGMEFPYLLVAFLAGACFSAALYFYYTSIQQISISRVLPIQGGFVPLFTLILAALVVSERLSAEQILAFLFLTVGAVLISFKKMGGTWQLPGLGFSLVAAFLFASHFVLAKLLYEHSNFVTVLFWSRWGMFAFAVAILVSSSNRRDVLAARGGTSSEQKGLFYLSRGAGGLAGLLQNYAISLGSVTIVNALQSVQFIFVLILTSFLSFKYPKLLKELITPNIILQKIVAICMVVVGLILLSNS